MVVAASKFSYILLIDLRNHSILAVVQPSENPPGQRAVAGFSVAGVAFCGDSALPATPVRAAPWRHDATGSRHGAIFVAFLQQVERN